MEFGKQMFLNSLVDVIFDFMMQAGCIAAAVAEKVVVGKVKIQLMNPFSSYLVYFQMINISQNGII
jgi:hypothetical protein